MATTLTIYGRATGCASCITTDRGIERHALDRLAESITHRYVDTDEFYADEARAFTTAHGLRQEAPLVLVHDDGTLVDQWTGYRPDKLKALAGRLATEAAPAVFIEATS